MLGQKSSSPAYARSRESGARSVANAGRFAADGGYAGPKRDPESDQDDRYFGTSAPSGRWSARGTDRRPQKFDPRQIRAYTSLNQFTIDPAKYEYQPTTWLRQMNIVLTNQGIPRKSWVTEALKCVSADISFNIIIRSQNHPPLPDSLDFSVFATWLCLSNQSSTHTVRQIEDMLHTIKQDKMRVNEVYTLFNRLVEELHQQRCLTDDDYRSTFAQNNMVMSPPVRESRETRSLYLAGLKAEIGTELRRLSKQQGLQGFLANGPGVLTRLMNSDRPAAASSQWMVFTRNFKSGNHEPRLPQLQECALLIDSTLKDLAAFNRARDPPASQATPERRMLTAPSAPCERSIFRTRRAPSPAPSLCACSRCAG